MRRIASILAAGLLTATLAAPAVASAQDSFNGGRIGGGSSQLLSGVNIPGGELREFGGKVDLEKYQGEWYQVAALPQPYTLQCANNTKAEYGVIDENTISVRNTCGTLLGEKSVIDGTAKVRSDASLRVNFPGVPFQNENGPTNYRVTYLADDYSLAIIGDPNRTSGFVLSRTPNLSAEKWQFVKNTLDNRGFWSCSFLTNPMTGGKKTVTPVCAL